MWYSRIFKMTVLFRFFSNMSRVEESEVTRYSRMIDDGSDWVGR